MSEYVYNFADGTSLTAREIVEKRCSSVYYKFKANVRGERFYVRVAPGAPMVRWVTMEDIARLTFEERNMGILHEGQNVVASNRYDIAMFLLHYVPKGEERDNCLRAMAHMHKDIQAELERRKIPLTVGCKSSKDRIREMMERE